MSSESTEIGLCRIGQISIRVGDVDRATAFYRDVLGMRYLFQVPKMSFFDCGGVRLLLGVAEAPEFDHPASILYYQVDDIHAAYEALKERGAEFVDKPHFLAKMPDHELWMVFLHDSEGNTLGLMSEVR
jgi:methylmalonyl-CoA/ethylmalonyl-CoA epimerase